MIETGRLVLRAPVADDLPWILAEMNTPGMLRHLGGAVQKPDEVDRRLAEDIAAFASGEYHRWTVWLRDEDQRVGRTGLFVIRTDAAPGPLRGQIEIGWMLAEPYQGRGLASEAARAALGFAFGPLGCTQVYSQTSDSNRASTKMIQRLGFVRRAELDYVDPAYPEVDNPTTVYRLDRVEWAAAA